MRAGRLVNVMLILQNRGRATARELATELEVSERTILRDLDELSGAGVPVYATRGRGGGFQLLEPSTTLPGPDLWRPSSRRPGRPERAQVRVSPEGRRTAAVLDALQPLRIRRNLPPDEEGWHQASFPIRSRPAAVIDALSLAPHLEVLGPAWFRAEVAAATRASAALYEPVTTVST